MRYQVQLGVPRAGGTVAWRAAASDFGRRLADRASSAVIAPRVDREIRRGRDFVRVVIVMTVDAGDVAEALGLAWRVFSAAAGDEAAGWDMASASAEARPDRRLPGAVLQGCGYAEAQPAGDRLSGCRYGRKSDGPLQRSWPSTELLEAASGLWAVLGMNQ